MRFTITSLKVRRLARDSPIQKSRVKLFCAEPDELELHKGELIEVLNRDDDHWWHGRVGDIRHGEFPSNYVQVVTEQPSDEGIGLKTSANIVSDDNVDASTGGSDLRARSNRDLTEYSVEPTSETMVDTSVRKNQDPSPPEAQSPSANRRVEESPLWNGRAVVEQTGSAAIGETANLKEMRAALAAAEAEQAALAERAKALRKQRVTRPAQEHEDHESTDEDEDDFVETEVTRRLQEANRRNEAKERRQSVEFKGLRETRREQFDRNCEIIKKAADAEARQQRAENAVAKAKIALAEEKKKMQDLERQREEALNTITQKSSSHGTTVPTAGVLGAPLEDEQQAAALTSMISQIVEQRIQVEFEERDAIIRSVRESMARLQEELLASKNKIVGSAGCGAPRSSRSENDMSARTPARHSPLKLPAVVDDGSGTTPGQKHAWRKQHVPGRRRIQKTSDGGAEFDDNLPRVANLHADTDRARHAQEAKALREVASKAAVRYAKCKTVVFAPDDVNKEELRAPPDTEIALEHVYAYAGEPRRKIQVGCNAVWSADASRAVYPVAGLVVAHDLARNRQSFFEGHAPTGDAVTAVARHPFQEVFATGQASKRPRVCVWALAGLTDAVKQKGITSAIADLQLPSGSRLVSLIRFSPCGKILLTLGADEGHTFTLWDWQQATPLLTQRAGVQPVYGLDFHPTLVVLPAATAGSAEKGGRSEVPLADLGPGDAQYAFASCGYRCFKFWTLALHNDADAPVRMSPSKPMGVVKKWKCEGFAATAGRAHQSVLQNATFTALAPVVVESAISRDAAASPRSTDEPTFVPDACYVAGTERGAIALWQQAEDEDFNDSTQTDDDETIRWLPRGRCLASAKTVHEGSILALTALRGRGAVWPPRVISAGKDGHIKVLLLLASSAKRPVEIVGEIVVATHAPVLGAPRSLCLDATETQLLVGTQGNALAVVTLPHLEHEAQPNSDGIDASTALNASFAENSRRAASTHANLAFRIILHGHMGRINHVAAHPHLPLIASVGTDKTLRLWDTAERRLAQLLRLSDRGLALAFDPTGNTLALGCENGDLLLLTCEQHPPAVNSWRIAYKRRVAASRRTQSEDAKARNPRLKQGSVDDPSVADGSIATSSKTSQTRHDDDDSSAFRQQLQSSAVLAVTFSPDGTKLAAACADKCIHVFGENFRKRCALLKGPTTAPFKLDFDVTSSVLQSNVIGREIFFWDAQSGRQLLNVFPLRDTVWATWTCTLGWAVHGIDWSEDVRAVARSTNAEVLLAPGPRNSLRLTRFPSLPGATAKTYFAHSKQISTLAFSCSDDKSFSAGGSDSTLIQWSHSR